MAKLLGPGDKFRAPRGGKHRELEVTGVSCSESPITHRVAVSLRATKGGERWALKLSIAEAYSLGRELLDSPPLDQKSWWYQNCRRARRNDSKCCQSCPFREWIERHETCTEEPA